MQRLLREQIDIVSPDTLVIAEEFGQWEDSHRRIDLLGVDKSGKLVVIELKRTDDGGHMELQAIRYAAMISAMTFVRTVEVYAEYLRRLGKEFDARAALLEFLEWDEPDEDAFANDVRIVLVSAEFSREITTAVLWLNERGIDIRCIRIKPYLDEGRVLADVQQIIPLPEAEDYQVRLKEKQQQERAARKSSVDFTKFDLMIDGQTFLRQWKRGAIYLVIRHLFSKGHSPDQLSAVVASKRTPIFRSAPGYLDSAEFCRVLTLEAENGGRAFKASRFFCQDDELLQFDGKTYSFTNQWGIEWRDTMKLLIDAFPAESISIQACP